MSPERFLRDGVNRDFRRLANLHVRHVGFVYFDFGLNDAHIGERQQHRAGVVHRADHRGLAFLDVPSGNDAVDRRLDPVLAQVVARALEDGAFLHDASGLRRQLLFALAQVRLGRLDVVGRALERFARRQLLAPQVFLPCQGLMRLLDLHFRGFNRLFHRFERLLRRLQRCRVAVNARPQ